MSQTDSAPTVGSVFEHDGTGERVKVVERMFDDRSDSPFVVERASDGERTSYMAAADFHADYSAVREDGC